MKDALAGVAGRIFGALVARRGRVTAVTVLAVALLAWLAAGVRLDGRVETFLPAADRHLAAYTEALNRFGTAETVFIDVASDTPRRDSPAAGGAADTTLLAAASAVESRLRASGLFREFVGRPSDAERRRTVEVVTASAPLLLDDAAIARIDERLTPDALADRMEEHVERLIGAAGALHEESFRTDPLGIAGIAMEPAAAGGVPAGARIEEQRIVSADGRHVLLVAIAAARIGDDAAARAIAAEIDAAATTCPPGVRVTWVGGHRFFLANATTLRADIERVSVAGAVLVLLIVAAAFRSPRVVALSALTIAVGGLCAVAAGAALFPSISGIALAVGASLAGVTVDYVLHLHARPRRGERLSSAAARTYTGLLPTITIGAGTSVVAYLVLLASPVPGHRQVGVVAAAGVAGAFLFSATFAAVAGVRRADRDDVIRAEPGPSPIERFSIRLSEFAFARRGAAAALAAVLCCAGVATLPFLRFETDMRRFESKDSATLAAEAEFAGTWGDAFSNSIVRIRAGDVESALRTTERVTEALRPLVGTEIRSLTSVTSIVPSAERQRARLDTWRRHWDAARIESARGALTAAAAAFGVRDDAFAPFLASLAADPAPVTPAIYERTAFDAIVRRHLSVREGDVESIVVVGAPAGPGASAPAAWVLAVAQAAPDAQILTRRGLAEAVVGSSRDQLARLAVPGFLLMGVVMWVYYRSVARSLIGLVPLAASFVTTAAGLHLCGVPLSLMNVAASLPIAGLGVDYAIFLIDAIDGAAAPGFGAETAADVGRASAPAVAAALTTAAGGVAMLAASHPAIWSMGLALTLGITTSLAFTWLGVPWLMERFAKVRA